MTNNTKNTIAALSFLGVIVAFFTLVLVTMNVMTKSECPNCKEVVNNSYNYCPECGLMLRNTFADNYSK